MQMRDAERLAQLARPRAQQPHIVDAAPLAHGIESRHGFNGAYQHARAMARLAAHKIQAPVDAVRAVDISVRGRAEHGRITRRHAAIRVRSGVQPVIRFRFHDAPAHAVDQHGHADQLARHAAGIVRKIDTREDFFIRQLYRRALQRTP